MRIEPFRLNVRDDAIVDPRRRLALTRFPDRAGEPLAFGTDVGYLKHFVDYWQDRFGWRAQEARLSAVSQFKAPLQGIGLHFLHVEGRGPRLFALLPCEIVRLPRSVAERTDTDIRRWTVMG
jgi:microsomal epoxide hydrolase